ncbi:MAG TPA: DUF3619 family protein [Burkholderiales bacterium]|nr:DUF3619 family protein [Burkholderiales bacterium]
MNERDLGSKIAEQLEQGANQLKPGTLRRLEAARDIALRQYLAEPELGVAGARHALPWPRHSQLLSARLLLPLALVLMSLGGIVYWQSAKQSNDADDIDTHLLTGDLPINAYLDKDFDAWLKRSWD